jgi:hypothetical protein
MKRLHDVFPLFLVAALSSALLAQTYGEETISGAGCVAAGVEGKCLVLKDAETWTLYNVFFVGPKPAPGTPIQFTGTFNRHTVSYCMQGKPVRVKEWHQSSMPCPQQPRRQ